VNKSRKSNRGVESLTPATSTFNALIHGDQHLADAMGTNLSKIRTLRLKRLIPFIKVGHKSIIYNLDKVLAALERLEVKPVTEKGGR
jgi:hypothetical protein